MTNKQIATSLGLLSAQAMESLLAVGERLRYLVKTHVLPEPVIKIGKRLFYAPCQVDELRSLLDRHWKMYNAVKVADVLGENGQTISRHAKAGRFPFGVRIGKRTYYRVEDLPKIKQVVEQHRIPFHQRCAAESLFTQVQAAKSLGIPRISFQYHLYRGRIIRPSVQRGGCRFYSLEDIAKLKEWFDLNYYPHLKARRAIAL